jgi:hypothetical protein
MWSLSTVKNTDKKSDGKKNDDDCNYSVLHVIPPSHKYNYDTIICVCQYNRVYFF